jgi:hypothetical protein
VLTWYLWRKKKSLYFCSKITLEVFSPGNSITNVSTLSIRVSICTLVLVEFQDVVTLSGTIHHFDCQTATIACIEIKSSEPSRNHNEAHMQTCVFQPRHSCLGDDAVKKELFGTSLYQHPVINDAPRSRTNSHNPHRTSRHARAVTSVFSSMNVQTSTGI